MRILLINWSCSYGTPAVFFFKEAKFSHRWRQLLELALVQISLSICISDHLSLAHIVEIRMNSLSVLFWDRSSSFYVSKSCLNFELMQILLIIWIAVIVHRQYLLNGAIFSPHPLRQFVVTCPCANVFDHLNFRLFIFGSHSWMQDEFTVSFTSRRKFILLFFKKCVWILSSYANFLDYLDCSHGAPAIFIEGSKFLSPSIKAVVGTCTCANSLTIWISDC